MDASASPRPPRTAGISGAAGAALALALAAAACGPIEASQLGARPGSTGACPVTDECQTSGRLGADGACAYQIKPDGTACGADNVCIKGSTCQAGKCVGTPALTCQARGPCFLNNACDPQKGCVDIALDGPCSPSLGSLTLSGCSTADYAAPITLGDDTLELIIDSGSTTTAVASKDCTSGCQGLDPVYSAGAGATFGGRDGAQYGDGSAWGGRLVTDTIRLPVLESPAPYTFAAMTSASVAGDKTSAFFTPSYCTGKAIYNTRQGIVGLANKELRSQGSTATVLMDLLASRGVGTSFTTQFCNAAGRLWLGGYDPAYVDGAFVHTPMLSNGQGFYSVALEDLVIDGTSIGAVQSDFGLTIADNGTSNLQLPPDLYQAVVQALAGNTKFTAQFGVDIFSDAQNACRTPKDPLTRQELNDRLPALVMMMRGEDGKSQVPVELAPTSSYLMYLPDAASGRDLYCRAIINLGVDPSTGGVSTILGNSVMRDHIVTFDRDKQRISFAPQKNCIGPDL